MYPVVIAMLLVALPAPPTCTCSTEFDALTRMIEEEYVGYHLQRLAGDDDEYVALRDRLRERAMTVGEGECLDMLRELAAWFGDEHLFVLHAPSADSAEAARLAASHDRIDVGELAVRAYLAAHADRLDPIEGIWYDRGERFAVLRDPAGRRGFLAITLESNAASWIPGMVKAEFRHDGDEYDGILYGADHTARRPLEVALRRNGALLHMPPVTWGREYPVVSREQTWLDPVDPRAPTFHRLAAGAVLVTIPSHDPQRAGGALAELVRAHEAELLAATTLVIDVRGNEGGSSYTTRPLAPFYASEQLRPPLVFDGGPSALLASPHAIAEAEENVRRNPNLPQSILDVVEQMKAHPGTLVRLPAFPEYRTEHVHPTPRNVAILIDGGVVSAGEAFVMEAGRSERVTLFGQNTGGVIDYQNVRMRRLCPDGDLLVGMPEYVGGHVLAGHPINGTGLAPHVRLEPGTDWVAAVLDHYRGATTRP